MLLKPKTCLGTAITLLLLLCSYPEPVESARILAAYSFGGTSHYMMHNTLIKELIHNGHQITMITGKTLKHLNLGQNYTEILIEPAYNFWQDVMELFQAKNIYDLKDLSLFDSIRLVHLVGVTTTEHALKFPKVQAIINHPTPRGQFDLLLCEQFYQEAFLALSHVYDIPVVTSATLGFENYMSEMMGFIAPWSFVPHGFTPLSDHMTFWERLQNTYYSLGEDILRNYHYFPQMDQMVQKYFGHLNVTIPTVSQMEKNVSVLLLNSYLPLSSALPLPPGIVFVGGMHIYPAKKLPQDLQEFLDGASDGVVYFSLGSQVQSKDMPTDKIKTFLEVFGSMKQRVIWKFENDSIKGLPSNVLIKPWLPQSDILAHPNVKVFITHGGLFGTQEAVHYGIPTLGMPFYCDQIVNLRKAEKNGYTIMLPLEEITRETLTKALNKLIYDPSYSENSKRCSAVFRDRPLSPRDTAMYWIDYVIRHKGAPQLRLGGLDLKWYQLYMLDVIGFVAAVILLTLTSIRFIIRRIMGSNGKKIAKKSKVN